MPGNLMEKVKKREIALGAWVNSTDPMIAEIFATFGCDWVMIDTEHEPIGRRDLMGLLMAFKGTSCTPIVRVAGKQPEDISWILDLGAGGVVIPQIANLADVKQAVSATRYHPLGGRGVSAMRASSFGKDAEYFQHANQNLVVMIQAETVWFLENIDEVVKTEGFDVVFVGPMDLSQSMGHLGHPEHPEVEAAIDRIIRVSAAAGKSVALGVRDEKMLLRRIQQGANIFILGSDYRFVRDGIKEKLAAAKAAISSGKTP